MGGLPLNALAASSLLTRIFSNSLLSHPYVQKICVFIIENFYLLNNLGLAGMGAKEILLDRQWSPISENKAAASPQLLQGVYQTLLLSQDHSREFFSIHGAFLLGSGAFGAADALCNIGLFSALSQGLFVLACAIALRYFVSKYYSASNGSEKTSAILGILASIGYILQVALWLMGAPAAIAVLMGILALVCITLKCIIDFKDWLGAIKSR
jgi:hypothetical protein